jgi:hypothetical protein
MLGTLASFYDVRRSLLYVHFKKKKFYPYRILFSIVIGTVPYRVPVYVHGHIYQTRSNFPFFTVKYEHSRAA